ncbi:alkaline phosphatase family protein [Streptomyces aurantiogriseus]
MQENRSFDHYFGKLRGVRGFGDPHPVTLPSGESVWHQSDGTKEVLPFHPTADDLGMQFLEGLPHSSARQPGPLQRRPRHVRPAARGRSPRRPPGSPASPPPAVRRGRPGRRSAPAAARPWRTRPPAAPPR